jgi:hypothetical protein
VTVLVEKIAVHWLPFLLPHLLAIPAKPLEQELTRLASKPYTVPNLFGGWLTTFTGKRESTYTISPGPLPSSWSPAFPLVEEKILCGIIPEGKGGQVEFALVCQNGAWWKIEDGQTTPAGRNWAALIPSGVYYVVFASLEKSK